MEAQLQRPSHGHHHHEDAGLHSVVEGEGEREHHDHWEKKSALKKVKDKAKKIKDTIKRHGHGHDDDVNNHEVDGSPMCESTVVRSKNLPREGNSNLEEPREQHERHRHHYHHVRDEGDSKPELENKNTLPVNPNIVQPKTKIVGLEEDPHAPNNSPLNIPPPNCHPTPPTAGAKQAQVAPLLDRFHNLNVYDAPVPVSKPKLEHRPDNPVVEPERSRGHSAVTTVAGKISSATCAAADTVISAKNVAASKLGYSAGGQDSTVQAYLSEKFTPGDEDKALSEVITDALHKQKEAEQRQRQRGKVTMSKEVAARLGPAEGSKREGEDALAAGEESSGQGLTDKLKDAVSSWLGKSAGIQTAQDSLGNAFVNNSAGSGDNVEQANPATTHR